MMQLAEGEYQDGCCSRYMDDAFENKKLLGAIF